MQEICLNSIKIVKFRRKNSGKYIVVAVMKKKETAHWDFFWWIVSSNWPKSGIKQKNKQPFSYKERASCVYVNLSFPRTPGGRWRHGRRGEVGGHLSHFAYLDCILHPFSLFAKSDILRPHAILLVFIFLLRIILTL